MLNLLDKDNVVNTCVILLLVAILAMTFINFNQINSYKQENYSCGCDGPIQQPINKQDAPSGTQSNAISNSNQSVENDGKNKLILYYTTWCGYSRNFMPIWNQIGEVVNNTPELNVKCEQHDCDKERNICNVANVNGFPTMIFVKSNGVQIPYEGARSLNAILEFVNKNK